MSLFDIKAIRKRANETRAKSTKEVERASKLVSAVLEEKLLRALTANPDSFKVDISIALLGHSREEALGVRIRKKYAETISELPQLNDNVDAIYLLNDYDVVGTIRQQLVDQFKATAAESELYNRSGVGTLGENDLPFQVRIDGDEDPLAITSGEILRLTISNGPLHAPELNP